MYKHNNNRLILVWLGYWYGKKVQKLFCVGLKRKFTRLVAQNPDLDSVTLNQALTWLIKEADGGSQIISRAFPWTDLDREIEQLLSGQSRRRGAYEFWLEIHHHWVRVYARKGLDLLTEV